MYSADDNAIRPVPVASVHRQRAEHHHVVRVTLASGRVLEISAPHPTADGRLFGDLRAGDLLEGQPILAVEVIPYDHEYTYDILPASSTHSYFAAGARIGTTLRELGANLELAAQQLVQMANDNGGRDNVSVILVRVVREYPGPRGVVGKLFAWLK